MHVNAKRRPRFIPRLDDELLFHEIKKVSRSETTLDGSPPETYRGVLACYACSSFTRHTFVGRRAVSDSADNVLYYEQVYRCACGKERVWGTECESDQKDSRSAR